MSGTILNNPLPWYVPIVALAIAIFLTWLICRSDTE